LSTPRSLFTSTPLPTSSPSKSTYISHCFEESIRLTSRHDEEWDGKPNTTSEDGFFGALNEFRKKATASMVKMGVDTTPADQKK
jgi:hypothetical protein